MRVQAACACGNECARLQHAENPGLLALAAAVASAAMDLSVQNICGCVVPLLYFICAISVRSRA